MMRIGKGIGLAGVASVAAVLAACGVRSSLEDDLASSAISIDAGAPDAPTPEDAGARLDAHDAGPDVALPTQDLGNVTLTSGRYASGTVQTLTAEAQFVPSVAQTGCSITPADSSGACTIETCSRDSYTLVGAGAIEVTGGSYRLALAQEFGGLYGPWVDGDASDDAGLPSLWLGGETLIVTARGGAVPPFVSRVVAPTEIMIQTPQPGRLLRQGAFAISWLGDSAGDVVVDVSEESAHALRYLECHFDVAAGFGVIPAEALGELGPGDATLSISTENRGAVAAGSWLVKTFARTHAADLEGREYLEAVTLE